MQRSNKRSAEGGVPHGDTARAKNGRNASRTGNAGTVTHSVQRAQQNQGFPVIEKGGFDLTFPDFVTALNLVAGVLAVYAAVTGELFTAAVLIIAGMVFDYFDGKIARHYGQSHDFGRELDSLADLVTFGIAPGVLSIAVYPGNNLVLAAAAIYGVAAAFRLARFNLLKEAGKAEKSYAGVPVPAAAVIVLLGTLLTVYNAALIHTGVMLIASLLMVSTLKVPKV